MGACASQKKIVQNQTDKEEKQKEKYQSILNSLKTIDERGEDGEIEEQQIIPVIVVIKGATLYKNQYSNSKFSMSEKDLRIDGKKITNSLKYYRPYVAKNKN